MADIFTTIKSTLDSLSINNAVAIWKDDPAPSSYCIITPIGDEFAYASDEAIFNIPAARITLYDNGNYLSTIKSIKTALLTAELYITEMTYLGYDDESAYHSYAIGVEQIEDMEE